MTSLAELAAFVGERFPVSATDQQPQEAKVTTTILEIPAIYDERFRTETPKTTNNDNV